MTEHTVTQVYMCGCGATIPVGEQERAGWVRAVMIGCLVWLCARCRKLEGK